jgi:hypothetical protein
MSCGSAGHPWLREWLQPELPSAESSLQGEQSKKTRESIQHEDIPTHRLGYNVDLRNTAQGCLS